MMPRSSGETGFLHLATVIRAGAALAALILLIATATFAPSTAEAQEPTPAPTPATIIRVDPTTQNVSAGTDVVVDIRVDNVTDLAAYEFEIQYEPSTLTFASVTNSTFLGSTGRSVTCLPAQFGPDTVRYGCVTFGLATPGPSGSGVLATLTFSTSCAGSSPLDFTLASLGDALGIGLPSQTQDGSATVTGGGACPTPTVTPTPGLASPTPSPTPTATATSTGPPPTPIPQLCAGAAGPAVCVLPVSQAAFTGAQVEIQVAVDNVFNLGAFQFDLVFDSVLLSPLAVLNAGFLGSTGRSTVCLPELLPDRVTFACASIGTEPPGPEGSGILALVILQAEAVGSSTLTLENALLADITSAEIFIASEQGGDVTIADPPTPTNTLTPTDTFTPTETATVPSPTPPATPTPGPLPETVVRIDPSAQNVAEGDDIVIDVVIDAVTGMGAYDITLAFDPALLTFVDVTNSSFLGSSGGSVVCVGPTVDETLGRVGFGCITTSATGVTGTGTLATVRLGTSCGGTGALTLANVSIANAVGGPIPSVAHNASVSVNGSTSCSPSSTATATPTLTATPTGPAPSTLVRVDPSSQGVVEGADVVVDLVVDNVTDLGGYTFTLSFDPTLLTHIDTLNGAFLESTGGAAFCLGPNVNLITGTVQFGCTMTGAAGADGTGILATVRFATFCGGTSALAVTQLTLADSAGSPIAIASQNGSATVIGSTACPTPVPTPTPTPTNTPTLALPTPATNVHFNPSSQGVTEGADVVFDLEIEDVTDLGAYQFTLAFDPTLLTFGSITAGPFLASTGGGVVCIGPNVDPIAGTATFGCVMTSAPGIAGGGILANVRLGTFCTGTDVLELTSLEIADAAGLPIPVGSQGSNVTVLGSTTCPTPAPPTATPTATPTGPTATPTATPTPPACDATLALTVCLQPADQSIAQGSDAVYEIAVANSPELGAFQVTLTFDESIASLSGIAPGTFLSSTFRNTTCLAPATGPGIVQYVCVSLEPEPVAPVGSGILAFVTLTGDAIGVTSLTLQDVLLTDIAGLAHPAPVLEGGSLSVGVAPTVAPSTTPTTTLSPTPSDTPTPTLSPTPCPGGICPTTTITPTPTDTPTPVDTPIVTDTPTATPTPAVGPITMRIDPANQSVESGTLTSVDVVVENVTDLGAFQFRLEFSPAVTSYQEVVVGPFLSSTGRSLACLPPIIGTGFVEIACASFGSTVPGPDGSGVIATITYVALAEGLSVQHLSNTILTDISSDILLPVVIQDGIIAVVAPATATPGSPSLSGFSSAPLRVASTSGRLGIAYPNGTGSVAAPAAEPGVGVVAIAKVPSEADLFIGSSEPLIITERAYNIPEGPGVGGFELAILFDPNLVKLEIDGTPFEDEVMMKDPNGEATTDRVATCLSDLAEGEIRFRCVSTGSDPGPTGTFDLVLIEVTPISGLPLRPAPGNGIEVILDDVAGNTQLSDTLGNSIALDLVGDAKVIVRVLESDVNTDCRVDVEDVQTIAVRFGADKGSKYYETWFDLEPEGVADGDIDINDVQAVYGRFGSECADPGQAQEPPTTTQTPTTTATITPTPSRVPPATPVASVTATPDATATVSGSPTPPATVTPTTTNTPTSDSHSAGTPAPTGTSTPTPTQGNTPTATSLPTMTPTTTPTVTRTPEPGATATDTPEPAATVTDTPEPAATATNTPEPAATVTDTPEPGTTATDTPEPAATVTDTPEPGATVTATLAPPNTATSTPVRPPTATPLPTATSISTPTTTSTPVFLGGIQIVGADVLPVTAIAEAGSLLGEDLVILRGWIEVLRGAPHTEDGLEVVDLEITSLELVGTSRFGLVSVTERANAGTLYGSGGQLLGTTPGKLFPATGMLNLFLDLEVPSSPAGPLLLHNETSLELLPISGGVEKLLQAWPPFGVTFERPDTDDCLPLVDEANADSELAICIRSLNIAVAPLTVSFSVGRAASQYHPADILGILPAVALPGVGQAPYLRIACAGLGLSGCDDSFGQDNVDALSFGSAAAERDPTVDFSVAAGALGSEGTAVAAQSLCPPAKPGLSPEPDSDVFRSVLAGTNWLLFDGNGPVGACQAAFPLGLLEAVSMRDELDAFVARDPSFVDRNADGVPESPVYFSLDAASPSLAAFGYTAGDILSTSDAATPSLYASHQQLGLQASDDLDGLCLAENGDGVYSASDTLRFSLAPGSPTLAAIGASAGDMIRPGTPPVVVHSAATLGLRQTDDIDALSCAGLTSITGGSGDVNCDATTNSIDAALILQRVAGLIASLPCEAEGDVNGGGIDSVDAALVLQWDAGLLLRLPV